jgi:hypothetical protein
MSSDDEKAAIALRWQLVCAMAFSFASLVASIMIYVLLLSLQATLTTTTASTPTPAPTVDMLELFRKRIASPPEL